MKTSQRICYLVLVTFLIFGCEWSSMTDQTYSDEVKYPDGLEQLSKISQSSSISLIDDSSREQSSKAQAVRFMNGNHIRQSKDSHCSNFSVTMQTSDNSILLKLPLLTVGMHSLYIQNQNFIDDIESSCSSAFFSYENVKPTQAIDQKKESLSKQSSLWDWECSNQKASCEYHFVVNQNLGDGVKNESYSHVTTTQSSGEGNYRVYVQAKDLKGNELDLVQISVKLNKADSLFTEKIDGDGNDILLASSVTETEFVEKERESKLFKIAIGSIREGPVAFRGEKVADELSLEDKKYRLKNEEGEINVSLKLILGF